MESVNVPMWVYDELKEHVRTEDVIEMSRVNHGRWVRNYYNGILADFLWHCSHCGSGYLVVNGFDFCPHCGAHMDEGERMSE